MKKIVNREYRLDYTYEIRYNEALHRFTMEEGYVKINDARVDIGSNLRLDFTSGQLELLFIKNPKM